MQVLQMWKNGDMREICSVTYMGATHDESVVDLLCKSTMHTDGLREIGTGHRSLE